MNNHLHVYFSPFDGSAAGTGKTDGTNHAMFYVSDNAPWFVFRFLRTFHKVDPGNVIVRWSYEKYGAPRNPIGEGVAIPLTARGKELKPHQMANQLFVLRVASTAQDASQWWVIKNLMKMEKSGFVQPGTSMTLMMDPRMNSTCWFELLPLKKALKYTLDLTNNGISEEEFAKIVAEFPAPDLNDDQYLSEKNCQLWISNVLTKMEQLGHVKPNTSADLKKYLYQWLEFPPSKRDLRRLLEIEISEENALEDVLTLSRIPKGLSAEDKYILEDLRVAALSAGISRSSDPIIFQSDVSQKSIAENEFQIPKEYFF